MDWEYVALSCWDIAGPAVDEHFSTQYASLQSQGWEEFIRAPWQIGREHASGAVIMRRPKDEPRMWTEGELRELAGQVYIGFDMEKECAGHRTWTEKEIEEIAQTSYGMRVLSRSLATKKEETNG